MCRIHTWRRVVSMLRVFSRAKGFTVLRLSRAFKASSRCQLASHYLPPFCKAAIPNSPCSTGALERHQQRPHQDRDDAAARPRDLPTAGSILALWFQAPSKRAPTSTCWAGRGVRSSSALVPSSCRHEEKRSAMQLRRRCWLFKLSGWLLGGNSPNRTDQTMYDEARSWPCICYMLV